MISQDTQSMVRTVASTQSEMTEIVLPNDTNVLGKLLGGRLMHFIDLTGAMAALPAFALARGDGVDGSHRLYPAGAPGRSGDAQVEREPGVYDLDGSGREGWAENSRTGAVVHVASAYLVFVAVDEHGP